MLKVYCHQGVFSDFCKVTTRLAIWYGHWNMIKL